MFFRTDYLKENFDSLEEKIENIGGFFNKDFDLIIEEIKKSKKELIDNSKKNTHRICREINGVVRTQNQTNEYLKSISTTMENIIEKIEIERMKNKRLEWEKSVEERIEKILNLELKNVPLIEIMHFLRENECNDANMFEPLYSHIYLIDKFCGGIEQLRYINNK